MGENYHIGLDISTKCCGVCILNSEGKLVELVSVSFDKDLSLMEKANFFEKEVIKFLKYNIINIFIEEPLKNGPNISTTLLLAKFNGILSMILYKLFKIEPQYITVYESRFIFFPEFVNEVLTKNQKTKVIEN